MRGIYIYNDLGHTYKRKGARAINSLNELPFIHHDHPDILSQSHSCLAQAHSAYRPHQHSRPTPCTSATAKTVPQHYSPTVSRACCLGSARRQPRNHGPCHLPWVIDLLLGYMSVFPHAFMMKITSKLLWMPIFTGRQREHRFIVITVIAVIILSLPLYVFTYILSTEYVCAQTVGLVLTYRDSPTIHQNPGHISQSSSVRPVKQPQAHKA
jgi:hypothetical protein